jgi:GMP synthase-like glutamine amidotransferase
MRPLTVFRHITCEGPGYLAEVLERNAVPYDIVRIDQGDTVPSSIDGSAGLVFMGGPMSVNDDMPWIEQELALIRQAQAAGLPVLGHCLGGQLICRALDGTVAANRVKEIGWHSVRSTGTAAARHWLGEQPGGPELFHWHGETFSLPEGADLLLENDNCAHQAFAIGNTLALQCHVEMTAPMVVEWASLYEDELQNPGDSVQSAEQMTSGLDERIEAAQQVADPLYQRWLQPVLNS